MALFGNLSSMPLPDLLQWAGQAGKTGTLELEREKHVKRIHFRAGRLIGCSSDEPASLLGQFLLSRGKITETDLRKGLERQQTERENLGNILIAMGAISREDLLRHVAEKAEETIYGLFDWPDAAFRFIDDAPPDPWVIEVDLRIEDVLLHGMRRFDEMKRLRGVFDNPSIVLRRTAKTAPPEITGHRAANAIYSSVDGRRTLEELLLHAHGSEFFVLKFLHQLLRGGLVEIESAARQAEEVRTEPPEERAVAGVRKVKARVLPVEAAAPARPPAAAAPNAPERRPIFATARRGGPGDEIEHAVRLLSRNEPEQALAILSAAYRDRQGDPTLRELVGTAERACRDNAIRILEPAKVPVITRVTALMEGKSLPATESYLLTLMDGKSDIRTILWLAPMRELDVLQALKSLLDRGWIELTQPVCAATM